jgi:hypothetical protein
MESDIHHDVGINRYINDVDVNVASDYVNNDLWKKRFCHLLSVSVFFTSLLLLALVSYPYTMGRVNEYSCYNDTFYDTLCKVNHTNSFSCKVNLLNTTCNQSGCQVYHDGYYSCYYRDPENVCNDLYVQYVKYNYTCFIWYAFNGIMFTCIIFVVFIIFMICVMNTLYRRAESD